MQFTIASVVAALAAVAAAKPAFSNSNFDVIAGQPFELKWSGASGPVTIELKTGIPPNGLKTIQVLATGLTGTSYTVTLPTTLASGRYAFTVADGVGEENTNYSKDFPLVGTGSSSSAVASTTSSSSSSSAVKSSTTIAPSTTASVSNSTTSATTSTGSLSTSTRPTSAATTSASSTSPAIPNSNSGPKVQSSLALVLLGAAAYAFLN